MGDLDRVRGHVGAQGADAQRTPVVGLVACSAQKLDRPAPARELYKSALFRKASAYAEATCDRWYILSALHGLVHPDTVLEPYDVRLGVRDKPGRPSNSPSHHGWAQTVRAQLDSELADAPDASLTVLAGELYRLILLWPTRIERPFTIPMQGMGIGDQLGWLTRELRGFPAQANHIA